ncbi:MAG TPA: hypothetical protein ENG47_04565 [Candidatus Aerophobetes bacterium]|uniref:Uncharacterized protein n=1 Tax=Aerophobetes bacterium TaxID=2030807 RepID=A0A7V0MZQ7_UNCAE|nr:hypothetical protein [Candidatus Aerophobetes bacterium]
MKIEDLREKSNVYLAFDGVFPPGLAALLEQAGINVANTSNQTFARKRIELYVQMVQQLLEDFELQEVKEFGPEVVKKLKELGYKDGDIQECRKAIEYVVELTDEGKSPEKIADMLYNRVMVGPQCLRLWKTGGGISIGWFTSRETNPLLTDPQEILEDIEEQYEDIYGFISSQVEIPQGARIPLNFKIVASNKQGLEAISLALEKGWDVNQTLGFPGVKVFTAQEEIPQEWKDYVVPLEVRGITYNVVAPQVMEILEAAEEGYKKRIETLLNEGKSWEEIKALLPTMVCSFFLSREASGSSGAKAEGMYYGEEIRVEVDPVKGVDELLEEDANYKGVAPVYAMVVIYKIFEWAWENNPVFKEMRAHGVTPPVPLIASTGPKSEGLRKLIYVEPFQSTVDNLPIVITVPESVFLEFLKNGEIKPGRIEELLPEAIDALRWYQEKGIDLIQIAKDLAVNGEGRFKADALGMVKGVEALQELLGLNP